jgi:hypothetical protein
VVLISIGMAKKRDIVYFIFSIILFYIISPRVLEKMLLLNEWLVIAGIAVLAWNRFVIKRTAIVIYVALLILWCAFHAVISLFRMGDFYYYLRNLVIFYSIFTFFIGFYLYSYLNSFIAQVKKILKVYIPVLLIFPNELLFDRFSMSTLFPVLLHGINRRWIHWTLVPFNLIYAVTYKSSTAFMIAVFLMLVFISPGYKFFKRIFLLAVALFTMFFIYMHSYISIIYTFNKQDNYIIDRVEQVHPLLAMDPNNTWRLILWDQILIDNFPDNLFGLGFGTPVLKYFPIEDYNKLASLPYVVGGHNSYIYLFGRLGIVFVILILLIYNEVFRDFFTYRKTYQLSGDYLIFCSFFAITIIALFNPVLETPIFAGTYWLSLGFVARAIHGRQASLA